MEAVSSPAKCQVNAVTHEQKGNKSVLPFRGGQWNNAERAGVFALYLNDPRTISNGNVGFRAALPSRPDAQGSRALCQCRGDKGTCLQLALSMAGKNKIPWKPLVALVLGEHRDTWTLRGWV